MEAKQLTLRVLEKAISMGLDNSNMDFFTENKAVDFCTYIGAINATGEHHSYNIVDAGLLIWGEKNFISIPDTIFTNKKGDKIAYYKL